jgi:hypothetical protein
MLVLAATAARADPAASYTVSGSTGAALWGLGNQPGTSALIFAFSSATPVQSDGTAAPSTSDDSAAPGPRMVFSVTQWSLVNGGWVQRQWYGDAPLDPDALTITGDLMQGSVDALVTGSVQQSSSNGTVLFRDIRGRIQIKWVGSSGLSNSSTAYTYQTPSYTTVLQSIGTGRMASVSATVSVDLLGPPIPLSGFGSLGSVQNGLLSVSMQ